MDRFELPLSDPFFNVALSVQNADNPAGRLENCDEQSGRNQPAAGETTYGTSPLRYASCSARPRLSSEHDFAPIPLLNPPVNLPSYFCQPLLLQWFLLFKQQPFADQCPRQTHTVRSSFCRPPFVPVQQGDGDSTVLSLCGIIN
jgi:hypothetical protein